MSIYSQILWYRGFYDTVYSCAILTHFRRLIFDITTTVPWDPHIFSKSDDRQPERLIFLMSFVTFENTKKTTLNDQLIRDSRDYVS